MGKIRRGKNSLRVRVRRSWAGQLGGGVGPSLASFGLGQNLLIMVGGSKVGHGVEAGLELGDELRASPPQGDNVSSPEGEEDEETVAPLSIYV